MHIKFIRLFRDGYISMEISGNGKDFELLYTERNPDRKTHCYYISVEQDIEWKSYKSNIAPFKGPWAWSSPIWVNDE